LLAAALGLSPWWGVTAALNPGLLVATMNDLAEPLAAALLLLGVLAYVRGRRVAGGVVFALGALAKDPLLLVGPAIAVWEVYRRRASVRQALVLAAAPVPTLAWWVWLRVQLGAWPFAHGAGGVGAPVAGWVHALLQNGRKLYASDPDTYQMADAHLGLLLVLAGLLVVLVVLALRLRNPAEAAFVPLFVILLCVTKSVTTYPKDLLRVAALALVLAPFFGRALAPTVARDRE
jgi:hypothetical protein